MSYGKSADGDSIGCVLGDYHRAVGEAVMRFEGTLDSFAGDGVMVFFNDPHPVPDPAARAVRMADAMRAAIRTLIEEWSDRGFSLGFGVEMAQGYATLGRIGFEGRYDYTAIGTVVNLAARLCGEAKDGEILVTQKIAAACRDVAEFEAPIERMFKDLARPLRVRNLVAVAALPLAAAG